MQTEINHTKPNAIKTYSEIELVEALRKGNKRAMQTLYDIYSGYLTAVCSRYIPNNQDLKDVLQESFIKIFTKIETFTFKGEGSLRGWCSRIVVNESLMFLRNVKKEGFITNMERLPETETDNEELGSEKVPQAALQEMIRNLPAGYRAVLNLYVFEDKSHREIAQLLDIKEDTSASQLHRAKKVLAKMIKEYNNNNR